jgi:hypothetical protein
MAWDGTMTPNADLGRVICALLASGECREPCHPDYCADQPQNADHVGHAPIIESEPNALGDMGTSVMLGTRQVYTVACECGWHSGSGVGWNWFYSKKAARGAWQDHIASNGSSEA